MQERSDEDLIRAVAGGEQRAYEELVRKYQDALARFIWRLVPGDLDREEVCQDVFVKAYVNLHQFKFDAKFSTWLYSIGYRTAISSLRKKRHAYDVFDEANTVDPGPGMEEDLADDQLAQLLRTEINRLDVEERSIVTLFHTQGCTVEEIAEIQGKPSGTIKSALFRIRKKLKDRLGPRLSGHYAGKYGEPVV